MSVFPPVGRRRRRCWAAAAGRLSSPTATRGLAISSPAPSLPARGSRAAGVVVSPHAGGQIVQPHIPNVAGVRLGRFQLLSASPLQVAARGCGDGAAATAGGGLGPSARALTAPRVGQVGKECVDGRLRAGVGTLHCARGEAQLANRHRPAAVAGASALAASPALALTGCLAAGLSSQQPQVVPCSASCTLGLVPLKCISIPGGQGGSPERHPSVKISIGEAQLRCPLPLLLWAQLLLPPLKHLQDLVLLPQHRVRKHSEARCPVLGRHTQARQQGAGHLQFTAATDGPLSKAPNSVAHSMAQTS